MACFKRFLPVGLMRSPITRTRSMGTKRVGVQTAAMRCGVVCGYSPGKWFCSIAFIAAMNCGSVPQQPPKTRMPSGR